MEEQIMRSAFAQLFTNEGIRWIFTIAGQLCSFIFLLVFLKKVKNRLNVHSLVFRSFLNSSCIQFLKNKTTICIISTIIQDNTNKKRVVIQLSFQIKPSRWLLVVWNERSHCKCCWPDQEVLWPISFKKWLRSSFSTQFCRQVTWGEDKKIFT